MLLALLAPVVLATTFEATTEICPICGEEVEVHHVRSSGYSGIDRDFLKRFRGAEPEEESTSTCGRCGYTGLPNEWNEEAVAPGMKRAIKAGALGEAGIPGKDEHPYAQVDVPARMVLLARTTELRGEAPEARAWAWHRAAWSVRLRAGVQVPGTDDLEDDPLWLEIYQETASLPNTADREVLGGARLIVDSAALPDEERACRLAAKGMDLLMRHGEHIATAKADTRVATCMSLDEFAGVISQASREAVHLDKALAIYETIPEPSDEFLYLMGELHRRRGHDDQALALLERAAERPLWSNSSWPEQQACIARGGSTAQAIVECMEPPSPESEETASPDE